MKPRTPLGDTERAIAAWARFRRLMRFMLGVTLAAVALGVAILWHNNGAVSIHLYIAAALGIGAAMLLMSALMGLVFLSSSAGHDEAVDDIEKD